MSGPFGSRATKLFHFQLSTRSRVYGRVEAVKEHQTSLKVTGIIRLGTRGKRGELLTSSLPENSRHPIVVVCFRSMILGFLSSNSKLEQRRLD